MSGGSPRRSVLVPRSSLTAEGRAGIASFGRRPWPAVSECGYTPLGADPGWLHRGIGATSSRVYCWALRSDNSNQPSTRRVDTAGIFSPPESHRIPQIRPAFSLLRCFRCRLRSHSTRHSLRALLIALLTTRSRVLHQAVARTHLEKSCAI